MNEVIESRAVSPCGGRSESPSQRNAALAAREQSSPSEAVRRTDLTATEPGQSAAETVTETDCRGGGPCGGREDEPEHAARRKTVKVQMQAPAASEVEELAARSGLARAHFVATALLLGARKLAREVGA